MEEGSSGSQKVMAPIIRLREGRNWRSNGLDSGKARSHILVLFGDRVTDKLTLRVGEARG